MKRLLDALQHELYEQAREKLAAELGHAVADDELLGELVRLFLSTQADGSVPGRKMVDASLFRALLRSSDALESAKLVARAEHEAVALPTERIATITTDATLPVRVRRRISTATAGVAATVARLGASWSITSNGAAAAAAITRTTWSRSVHAAMVWCTSGTSWSMGGTRVAFVSRTGMDGD